MKALLILLVLPGLLFGEGQAQVQTVPERMRLVTYNVWYGFSKIPQRKAGWIKWMSRQQPNVVCLQELNGYTSDQLKRDAQSWGHKYSVLLKEDGFPTGLTSQFPIQEVQRFRKGFQHGAMRVFTAGVYVYVIHLHPSNWRTRQQEIKLVLADVKRLPDSARVLLVGDFNTFSPRDQDHYQAKLEAFFTDRDNRYREVNLRDGRLDYSVVKRIESDGFLDLEAKFRTAFQGTFPTEIEKPGDDGDSRRLDYVFANPVIAKECVATRSIVDAETSRFSDHYPVIADFKLTP